ncbi:hypothetical protein Bhyg_06826 [Pseudolycoriella hygida]|uniref:Uncharacterized protein n=1 Tax=Pseudolycoriella hygida TaxID=35572 RepID=A0A9Q0N222_9DIPT|nr:hypothetical protein Bhyg_06826 [Pseudolycoriella hygida]
MSTPTEVITEAPLMGSITLVEEKDGCSTCCTRDDEEKCLWQCVCTPICEIFVGCCCLICQG